MVDCNCGFIGRQQSTYDDPTVPLRARSDVGESLCSWRFKTSFLGRSGPGNYQESREQGTFCATISGREQAFRNMSKGANSC